MKYMFATIFGLLALFTIIVYANTPQYQVERPVLYWVTDRNPARQRQIEAFHQWLIDHGHVDKHGGPAFELRLDVANMDASKQTIQSVSGVASDLMDTYDPTMRLFQAMGVLTDLTEDALMLGFDPEQTYPAIRPAIAVNGRQYRYPANVSVQLMWANTETLARYGFEPPPTRWTWEEFEALGIAFRDAANPPGTHPSDRRFLASDVPTDQLLRSTGLSVFNETLTASALDDPRYVSALETKRRWVYELNILPTPDDTQAFASAQGYGGMNLQLFDSGNYAMVVGGRYLLIQFRRFPALRNLKVVETPHAGFPSATIQTRAVAVYAGSEHPDLAMLFLQFLASEEYNRLIVDDADALPPNPKFTQSDAFLRPDAYPHEAQAHQAFIGAAHNIAIGNAFSPYLLPTVVQRLRKDFEDRFMHGRMPAGQAAAELAQHIDAEIMRELERRPELRSAFDADLVLQKQIEQRKASGEPLPEAWIKNPFHRAYYARTGQLEDPIHSASTR